MDIQLRDETGSTMFSMPAEVLLVFATEVARLKVAEILDRKNFPQAYEDPDAQ